ncbi:Rad9 protein [Babesia caballi]|uniref:Rad9 protein n=1 Tax=Babesia caballi TaxID=5871 RepID=A0AAV4LNN0_BABCB|nr:Rad9 protein [Babesia caballi]
MEYELNASQALLLKKIFILFRHVSANVQVVATRNGLNLYALNGANSAWLHIQLGRQFFRRIEAQEHDQPASGSQDLVEEKYWLLTTKNLCQALNVVSPAGAKNQGYSAVFLKDMVQGGENTVRTTVALEKVVIREETEHANLVSFTLSCAGEHIQRSVIISYENTRVSVPDDVHWPHWHFLRIQPTVLYKSINPYWSPFDDISIAYDASKDQVSLTIVKSSVKPAARSKTKASRRSGISGKITINSSHFLKLKVDENLPEPKDVAISLKELLSLSSFCESVKSPLALLLRNPGDPVIVVFGDAVDIAEETTGQISIHQVIAEGASQYSGDPYDNLFHTSPNKSWSGSLWLSTTQPTVEGSPDAAQTAEAEEEEVSNFDSQVSSLKAPTEPVTVDSESFLATFDEPSSEEQPATEDTPPWIGNLTRQERDRIYRTLALDFVPPSRWSSSKGTNSNVGSTPMLSTPYDRSIEGSVQSHHPEREKEESVYDQLAGIW